MHCQNTVPDFVFLRNETNGDKVNVEKDKRGGLRRNRTISEKKPNSQCEECVSITEDVLGRAEDVTGSGNISIADQWDRPEFGELGARSTEEHPLHKKNESHRRVQLLGIDDCPASETKVEEMDGGMMWEGVDYSMKYNGGPTANSANIFESDTAAARDECVTIHIESPLKRSRVETKPNIPS